MTHDRSSEKTKPLLPLRVGDHVLIQNQTGNHPKRWDKRGVIASCEGFDQYIVIVDGSRRLTKRNRKFLRRFEPYEPVGMTRKGDSIVDKAIDRSDINQGKEKENLDRYPEDRRNMILPTDPVAPRVYESEYNVPVGQSGMDRLMDNAPVRRELPEQDVTGNLSPSLPELIEDEAAPVVDLHINNTSPLRRSTRTNKGKTSRYDDYET